MTRKALLKIAATGMIALMGVGAQSFSVMANAGDQPRINPERAARSADRAGESLDRGRTAQALRFAEEAVAMAPDNAGYRTLLAQVYLASGRFASAEASFAAARELGAVDAHSIIGHALTMIAMGHSDQALALLDENAQTLPASDFGLALALAGQPERGAMILTDVVRAGGSTARDRQNLALAFALSGRWLESRLIATQDIGPDRVGARMEQWSAMVQSVDPRVRIAGLVGSELVTDPGMPVRLALRTNTPTNVALAQAEDPAPLALYAPAPPSPEEMTAAMIAADAQEAAPVNETPVRVAAVDVPATQAPVAPNNELTFVSNPVIQQLRSMVAMVMGDSPAPAREAAAPARPARTARVAGTMRPVGGAPAPTRVAAATGPVQTRGWAVQLGAYDSVGVARDAWMRLSRRHAALGSVDAISTSATVRGSNFYRLTATGFDSRAEAAAACSAVRSGGGSCFVRQLDGSDPVRWASRNTPTRVASR